VLGQQERYPESLQAFEKAVSPGEAKANLAFILTTRGKHDEAKALYRQALIEEPDLTIAAAALRRFESPPTRRPFEPGMTANAAPSPSPTASEEMASEPELIPAWPRPRS
jgi:tetratricopeptide (TPR) repeat protein